MFDWIRRKVMNAVLAGVNDAMERLEQQAKGVPDEQDRLLEERVKLLTVDEPKRRKGAG